MPSFVTVASRCHDGGDCLWRVLEKISDAHNEMSIADVNEVIVAPKDNILGKNAPILRDDDSKTEK